MGTCTAMVVQVVLVREVTLAGEDNHTRTRGAILYVRATVVVWLPIGMTLLLAPYANTTTLVVPVGATTLRMRRFT